MLTSQGSIRKDSKRVPGLSKQAFKLQCQGLDNCMNAAQEDESHICECLPEANIPLAELRVLSPQIAAHKPMHWIMRGEAIAQSRKQPPRALIPSSSLGSIGHRWKDFILEKLPHGNPTEYYLIDWHYSGAAQYSRTIDIIRGILHQPIQSILNELRISTQATLATIVEAIASRPPPTESEFRRLATENPNRLIWWIDEGTLRNSQLTFAAEALAHATDSALVVPCLLRLLTHPASLVREGAIYGLEGHLDYANVRNRLAQMASDDPRDGVRDAATEALE